MFRSLFLLKTLAASPRFFLLSLTGSLCPLLFKTDKNEDRVSPFFSVLSYDPSGVTIGEVLPAVTFSPACELSLSLTQIWGWVGCEAESKRSGSHRSSVSCSCIKFLFFCFLILCNLCEQTQQL